MQEQDERRMDREANGGYQRPYDRRPPRGDYQPRPRGDYQPRPRDGPRDGRGPGRDQKPGAPAKVAPAKAVVAQRTPAIKPAPKAARVIADDDDE